MNPVFYVASVIYALIGLGCQFYGTIDTALVYWIAAFMFRNFSDSELFRLQDKTGKANNAIR